MASTDPLPFSLRTSSIFPCIMICLLLPYRSSVLLSCILVSFAPVLHSVIHVLSDFSSKKAEWLQQVKGTTKKSDLDALVSSLREELGQLRVAQVRLISQHPTSCYLLPRLRFCHANFFSCIRCLLRCEAALVLLICIISAHLILLPWHLISLHDCFSTLLASVNIT